MAATSAAIMRRFLVSSHTVDEPRGIVQGLALGVEDGHAAGQVTGAVVVLVPVDHGDSVQVTLGQDTGLSSAGGGLTGAALGSDHDGRAIARVQVPLGLTPGPRPFRQGERDVIVGRQFAAGLRHDLHKTVLAVVIEVDVWEGASPARSVTVLIRATVADHGHQPALLAVALEAGKLLGVHGEVREREVVPEHRLLDAGPAARVIDHLTRADETRGLASPGQGAAVVPAGLGVRRPIGHLDLGVGHTRHRQVGLVALAEDVADTSAVGVQQEFQQRRAAGEGGAGCVHAPQDTALSRIQGGMVDHGWSLLLGLFGLPTEALAGQVTPHPMG